MDQLIAQFWQLGTLYLCFAVIISTFFVRRIVEMIVPSAKKAADENDPKVTYKTKFAAWWNGVILYALPVLAGIGFAMGWQSYFCAGDAAESLKDAGMFGAIIGWFSSFLYKVVRKTLKKKTGIDPIPGPIDPATSDSEKPPAKEEESDEEESESDEKKDEKGSEDSKEKKAEKE